MKRASSLLIVILISLPPVWAGVGDILPACDMITPKLVQLNCRSKIDKRGCCVFTSAEAVLLYHHLEEWRGFRDWVASKYPGGGNPAKLRACMEAYAKEKGISVPRFLQAEGHPDSVMPLIRLAIKTGRPCGVSDCGNPGNYDGEPVNHFTCLIHCDDQHMVFVDNNYIYADPVSLNEGLRRLTTMVNQKKQPIKSDMWAFIVLEPPPPPVPLVKESQP
jgi:hypothetical protein